MQVFKANEWLHNCVTNSVANDVSKRDICAELLEINSVYLLQTLYLVDSWLHSGLYSCLYFGLKLQAGIFFRPVTMYL